MPWCCQQHSMQAAVACLAAPTTEKSSAQEGSPATVGAGNSVAGSTYYRPQWQPWSAGGSGSRLRLSLSGCQPCTVRDQSAAGPAWAHGGHAMVFPVGGAGRSLVRSLRAAAATVAVQQWHSIVGAEPLCLERCTACQAAEPMLSWATHSLAAAARLALPRTLSRLLKAHWCTVRGAAVLAAQRSLCAELFYMYLDAASRPARVAAAACWHVAL